MPNEEECKDWCKFYFNKRLAYQFYLAEENGYVDHVITSYSIHYTKLYEQWFNQNNLIVMEKERSYCCVGLMSGTSCDGLDMVLCDIFYKDGKWNYELLKSTTVAYDEVWEQRLRSARTLSGYDLIDLHRQFGELIGTQVKIFVSYNFV